QFLWLDEFNSAVRMQEKFLAFLTLPEGASRREIEDKQSEFKGWKDYLASPQADQVPPEQHEGAQYISVEP
ncbi:MAG TPA: hypothetical protein VFL42_05735, partial [Terriglobales bacterium]|nr:hypothetical protein [Terriglobales bacterium]